jgi:hypothetical protein
MAIAVMSRVFAMSAASISSTERLVLLALANHADATGNRVFPSVATIVDETSLARRTIQLALRALAGRGFIVAVGRRSRGTMVYRINLARLVERERAAHLRPEHGAADSQQPACGASATRDICTNAVQPVHLSGAPNAPDPSSDRHVSRQVRAQRPTALDLRTGQIHRQTTVPCWHWHITRQMRSANQRLSVNCRNG